MRWHNLLAIPTVLALAAGGVLLAATSASAASDDFAVLSPAAGTQTVSRVVVFVGTGTTGSTINVLDVDGDPAAHAAPVVVADGVWATVGVYPEDATIEQTVTVIQMTGASTDAVDAEATVDFTLPPELIEAPVITSPTAGETVVPGDVTFSGTGVAGENIFLVALPTSVLDALEALAAAPATAPPAGAVAAALDPTAPADPATAPLAGVAAAPVDPTAPAAPAVGTDPIVVDADGTWTVSLSVLAPNAYTVVATHIELNELGVLTAIRSAPSDPVEFTVAGVVVPAVTAPLTPPATAPVVARPVVATPAVAIVPTAVRPSVVTAAPRFLAATGVVTIGLLPVGALLTVAGVFLLVLRRKRARA